MVLKTELCPKSLETKKKRSFTNSSRSETWSKTFILPVVSPYPSRVHHQRYCGILSIFFVPNSFFPYFFFLTQTPWEDRERKVFSLKRNLRVLSVIIQGCRREVVSTTGDHYLNWRLPNCFLGSVIRDILRDVDIKSTKEVEGTWSLWNLTTSDQSKV